MTARPRRATRWRPVATLTAAVLAGACPAPAAAAGTPCDFGPQQTVAYTPGGEGRPAVGVDGPGSATVCEQRTRVRGTEPILARGNDGTLFLGMATERGLHDDPRVFVGEWETALLRSRDDGATWQRIPLPPTISAGEGMPNVDPVTNRLFVSSFSIDLTRCGQPVAFSDDDGAAWTETAARPGCEPYTRGDWPKLFTGPFKRRRAAGTYPQAVYLCNFVPNILVAAAIGCWRSDDGGAHFAFVSLLPTLNGACRAGDQQGGTGATIVHGTGRVLSNGDVVVPLTVCGRPAVVRSSDEGRTWAATMTGGDSLGLEDVLAGDEGIVLAVNDHVWSENLARDDDDNLYFAYLAADGVRLDISRDGGRTWRRLGAFTPPELRRAIAVSITARGTGELALTYYGTADRGDAFGARGMNWRAWMTYTPDALASRPVFHSAPTSPADQPTMPASMPGCCTTFQSFLEYTGVRFTGLREIGGAFTRWPREPNLRDLTTGLPELSFTRMSLPALTQRCAERRSLTVRVPSGMRRVRATQDGTRRPIRERGSRHTMTVDLRRARPGTVTLRLHGTDRRGRRVTVARRYRVCA